VVGVALFALVRDHALAGKARRLIGEAAVGIDCVRNGRVDAVGFQFTLIFHPNVEVLAAVTGGGMNESGTGIMAHMIARKNGNEKIVAHRLQGMDTPGASNRVYVADSLKLSDAGVLEDIGGELVGQHELVAYFRPIALRCVDDLVKPVLDLW